MSFYHSYHSSYHSSLITVQWRRRRAFKMASENKTKIEDANETDVKETEEIVLPSSKKSKGIIKDPNFAVVCSFIEIFGPLLHFKELSIDTLQQFFDTPTQGNGVMFKAAMRDVRGFFTVYLLDEVPL